MEYIYSATYGDRSKVETRKRLKDRRGDEIPWQSEYDNAVDKALIQNMKEDKLSFPKLLAVLRKETAQHMKQGRGYTILYQYVGHDDVLSYEGFSNLMNYWKDQLAYVKQTEQQG